MSGCNVWIFILDHASAAIYHHVVRKDHTPLNRSARGGYNQAKVNLFMLTTLNQNSNISQIYPNINFLQMKIDINFEKQNDQWLIKRIEIRKINQQSVSWNQGR